MTGSLDVVPFRIPNTERSWGLFVHNEGVVPSISVEADKFIKVLSSVY